MINKWLCQEDEIDASRQNQICENMQQDEQSVVQHEQQDIEKSINISEGFHKFTDLKYGCNPHQKEASIYLMKNSKGQVKIFIVLNGTLGYINTLDAINS